MCVWQGRRREERKRWILYRTTQENGPKGVNKRSGNMVITVWANTKKHKKHWENVKTRAPFLARCCKQTKNTKQLNKDSHIFDKYIEVPLRVRLSLFLSHDRLSYSSSGNAHHHDRKVMLF